jgi:CubicO group peptidase (beta-lactamase class C family)
VEALRLADRWPVETVALAVVRADGALAGTRGPLDRPFRLASVTKLLSAYAVLIAVEEGAVELDLPAGPPGATVRHLLAHASGLAFDQPKVITPPATRRIYSNAGFDALGILIEQAVDMPFGQYLAEAVLQPLGMAATELTGSPAHGISSTVEDLVAFAAELQRPRLLHPSTVAAATVTAFPGLAGVLPGYGRHDPNDWGLGFELRDGKTPHWTGTKSSPGTYGHFGRSGTFLWVDPAAAVAGICLTNRDFGDWAVHAWPDLTDAILAELRH